MLNIRWQKSASADGRFVLFGRVTEVQPTSIMLAQVATDLHAPPCVALAAASRIQSPSTVPLNPSCPVAQISSNRLASGWVCSG